MPRRSQEGNNPDKSEQQKTDWVFLINNDAVCADYEDRDLRPSLCKLRHPRLNAAVMFLFSANCQKVFEINCYKDKFTSWFIGNSVHSDGAMYMTSPVDPLFLVLPYLIRVREKSSQFMTLDQIVYDEDFPDCHKLLTCCSSDQLALISDCKDIGDNLQVYRYSQENTINWLKAKTENLADALEQKNISVDTKGSHSAIFVRSKSAVSSRESFLEYAHGIISDYVSCDLQTELRKVLELPEVTCPPTASQTENEPPNKKAKLTTDLTPVDDYSKNTNMKKDKSKTQQTSAQKKLSKVDKTGMKSISSFFSPKA